LTIFSFLRWIGVGAKSYRLQDIQVFAAHRCETLRCSLK
jgi:hypothetical protein